MILGGVWEGGVYYEDLCGLLHSMVVFFLSFLH